MTNRQLPDFLTAENDLDGQEPVYIAQGGKTRKTLLSKIKEFIIGTTALTTTDTTVTGAIEEVKGIADNNTTQLKENVQNITNLQNNKANLITTPQKTISDITYYISPTGNDNNDGLSSSTPFKTIQHAINILPQIINHVITINIASGTYGEDVLVKGFIGNGSIIISGATTLSNATNYVISSFTSLSCMCSILVKGIGAYSTSYHGFSSGSCNNTSFINCLCGSATTSYAGFCGYNDGYLYINGCCANSRASAIFATNGTKLVSENNTGSSNNVGINSISGTVMKRGTQPSGTVAETSSYGGVIR